MYFHITADLFLLPFPTAPYVEPSPHKSGQRYLHSLSQLHRATPFPVQKTALPPKLPAQSFVWQPQST